MSELPVLDAVDQRILGSLLEKQTTVPATYPLTANALRSACNQTSSRDPITDFDQQTVERTAKSLKERGLLRIVWADTGRRTLKYHQILDEVLGLDTDERAILTVLLLRGEQAPGELRTRTERLHPFADRHEVEACLHRMANRPLPLVRELARRPGQQDRRWVHLLGSEPEEAIGTTAGTGGVDRSTDRSVGEDFSLGWVSRHVDVSASAEPTVSVTVVDVDAAYREALERGDEIVHPLTTEAWGVTRFFVRAPDGNVLNIVQQH